jgi:hypothetical protein
MKATRERQERFMESFGRAETVNQVALLLRRHGPSWLTDEQMDQIVSNAIREFRFVTRIRRRNRRHRSAS